MNKLNLFKKLLLLENKERFIKNLPFKDEEKDEIRDFFKSHVNLENEINWQSKDLKMDNFISLFNKYSKDAESLFKDNNLFKIHNIENSKYLFVSPLKYEAAIFMNSFQCGGGGAKWCIGTKKDCSYWNKYILRGSRFILVFNKNYKTMNELARQTELKYMIEEKDGEYTLWDQKDEPMQGDLFLNIKLGKDTVKDIKSIDLSFFDEVEDNALSDTYVFEENPYEGKSLYFRRGLTDSKLVDPNFHPNDDELTFAKFFDGITAIGPAAFKDCVNLSEVVLPEGITYLADSCFENTGLQTVIMKDSEVIRIGGDVFKNCKNLRRFSIPIKKLFSIEPSAFDGCGKIFFQFRGSKEDFEKNLENYWDLDELKEFFEENSVEFTE